ncbi:hypothetical protein FWF74_00630, partial [Candidatus Saccharibacteria bacterium]|nr:hypothetical protein [Candidatus Saccharibacteria bacterium]
TPAYAATSTTNHIKINIYDSTNLDTMLETCDQIKQNQEQNHTYTDESYEKLMEACEKGLSMLDCLENAEQNNADASECGDIDEEKDNIEDAINELETAPTNPTNPNNPTKPTPPNTGTWTIKLFNITYQLPILPFIMLSFATLLTIGLTIYLTRKRIMEKGIGGVRIKNPWTKDSYERVYEGKLVRKHESDPLTEIIDVSQIVRKYRIKFVLWHTIPVSAIILAFFVFLFATAPIKAQTPTPLPTLDETAIATVSDVIININKKNETADPIERSTTITTTVTTENETGYTLSAKLNTDQDTTDAVSAGITTELNAEELSTTAVEIYSSDDDTSPDTQNHTLFVTAPANIANGVYTLSITYETEDNEIPEPPATDPPSGYQVKTTAIVPNFASTIAPSGNGSGTNGPQFSISGSGFGAAPTVTIGGQPCTSVSVDSTGTAITCTGPVSGMTDGEKRVFINGVDAGDNYTVWYSSYNFPTMQSLTTATCSTTPTVYRDIRDSQLYYVAKLADNKCWQIDNLRYKPNGDTIGTNQAGFSATQVWTGYLTQNGASSSTSPNQDSAKYVDPIQKTYCYNNTDKPTENISKCGLLYNFYTATAGTGVQSIDAAGTQATGSICPANWRLPTTTSTASGPGNGTSFDYADFAVLNASMNAGTLTTGNTAGSYYSNWRPSGAFHGVFSGYWYSSFNNQGSIGYFWSSSVRNSSGARYLDFSSSYVHPGDDSLLRNYGFGVRCVVGL